MSLPTGNLDAIVEPNRTGHPLRGAGIPRRSGDRPVDREAVVVEGDLFGHRGAAPVLLDVEVDCELIAVLDDLEQSATPLAELARA